MSRLPFPKRSEKETDVGDMIHSDICGPMRVISNGRNSYFVTFIDDCSGWCEKFIKQKNQVLDEFENLRTHVETHQVVSVGQRFGIREQQVRRFIAKARYCETFNCPLQSATKRYCRET